MGALRCLCIECGCDKFNDQFILKNQVAGENWHTVRLGIAGGNDPDCHSFLTSSVPDGGFLLFWTGGGGGAQTYKRNVRPDGVTIELKTQPTPFDTAYLNEAVWAYAPEYIHLLNTTNGKFLNFDYGPDGSPATRDQPVKITSNCGGSICDWSVPGITSAMSPRHILVSSLPATINLAVSGMTGPGNCGGVNKNFTLNLLVATSFDGSCVFSQWAGPSDDATDDPLTTAGVRWNTEPVVSTCQSLPDNLDRVLLATMEAFAPFGGDIKLSLLCSDAKDAYSATWPALGFANIASSTAPIFGCNDSNISMLLTG